MLHKDPAQRLSMAEALEHAWIRQDASAAPATLLSSVVVERLQSFTRTSRLERLLLNVAAHQLTRCLPGLVPHSHMARSTRFSAAAPDDRAYALGKEGVIWTLVHACLLCMPV